MRRDTWLIIFILALIADLVAIQFSFKEVQYCSKPLVLFALLAHFIFQTENTKHKFKKWIIFALLFSWAGDILLMFEEQDSIYFLAGLSAFLIAHIFYIIFFHSLRVKEGIRPNLWFLVIVVAYYFVLIMLLSPFLGDMKMPVRLYGIVISFMFM